MLLSCNPLEPPAHVRHLITLAVGPEVLAGSTRLRAGTVTKLALNMISTGAMVQIGKVHGNRMVDVHASNAKLRLRARRMVEELGEVDEARAQALLLAAEGSVKLAIAMARTGLDRVQAAERLAAQGGQLRRMLEEA